MEVTDGITRLNGVSAYSAQFSLGKNADSNAGEDFGQDSATTTDVAVSKTSEESNQKSFGIKLGKLGIRYVSEEPDVDYDVVAEEALKHAERAQAAAYKSEMEVAMLFSEIHAGESQGQDAESEISPLQAHYGNKAYSRMAQSDTTEVNKGILLGIA